MALLVSGVTAGAWARPRPCAAQLPAGFVDLADVVPDIATDMRYAGSQNFVGRPVRGYGAPRCWLTRRTALALRHVQRDLASAGVGLLVYDCYRPPQAVADFVAWSRTPDDGAAAAVRGRHYPTVPKGELFARGYIAARSGHSRGSTVDLTLVPLGQPRPAAPAVVSDCRKVEGRLAPDGSLNMGTTFDCLDERAHTDDPAASPEARRNRHLLRRAMERRGFTPYAKEWWHFTLAAEAALDSMSTVDITPRSR